MHLSLLAQTSTPPSPGGPQIPTLSGPDLLLSVPWGSAPGHVARKDGNEGASLGPMSFTVDEQGRILILDQVNGRIAVFRSDGRWDGAIPLPGTTFEELEIGPDGRLLLLDRHVRQALLVLHPLTLRFEEYPVPGAGIPEGGGITALLRRDDGIWLEFAHEHSVRVLDSLWNPCPRTKVPGRPAAQPGGFLEASLDWAGGADFRAEDPAGTTTLQAWVRDEQPIGRIIDLADGPPTGQAPTVWMVYHCFRHAPDGDAVEWEEVRGRLYAPGGTVLARFSSPYVLSQWEQFREFRILPDGTLIQMAFTVEGVKLLRWRAK